MIYIPFTPLLWSIFFFLIVIIFAIDNYIYKDNKIQEKSLKHSFFCYSYWFFLSLFFILFFWFVTYKNESSTVANKNVILFFTGYLLEVLLSIDNVFVWFLVFKSLKIPIIFQKKVLLYGIWSAVILRFVIIFYGQILFSKYHWILYFFAMFFLATSLKIIFFNSKNNSQNDSQEKNIGMFWISNFFRVSQDVHDKKFFFVLNKKLFITPLLLSLIIIELSDIIFSIDSIPAIFSITDNFFIIVTSNIFAVLGLRSMYFFISTIVEKYPEIEYGLSGVLIFIALKILLEKFVVISTMITLLIILIIIMLTLIINKFLKFKKH
ncbi:TerC/Alx family metal homeostasis membrane protein [Buchnera aphidicola]|uniref:TerC/Alx family metal homeostasis membrane protein n=1 Tax=Buchnera aphidicola TaxID=9 RepID=UPI003464BAD0